HSLCLCEHEQTVGTIVLILRFLSPRFSDGACFGFVLPSLEGDLGLPLGNFQSFFGSLHGGSTFTQRNFKSAIGSAQFFCCELCDKSRRVGLAFLQHGNVALAFCLFTTLSSQFGLVVRFNLFHVCEHHEQNRDHGSSTEDDSGNVGAAQHTAPHHILVLQLSLVGNAAGIQEHDRAFKGLVITLGPCACGTLLVLPVQRKLKVGRAPKSGLADLVHRCRFGKALVH